MASVAPRILTSVAQVRSWRGAYPSVGFVATMGALHEGHLSLVRRSLAENPATLVSIFVNPAQFSPSEDLDTYPRTLDEDLEKLRALSADITVFCPKNAMLYPYGITTDVAKQRGAFVEMKGFDTTMEGASRPGFFRGVATVVLKLFNIVEPTRAYFGQKDIQQALLLRHMCTDLHLRHPEPRNLVIVPTTRDTASSLALSSRNAYLGAAERRYATVLIEALEAGKAEYERQLAAHAAVDAAAVQATALAVVEAKVAAAKAAGDDVAIRPLYITLNDPQSFEELSGSVAPENGAILSGAVVVGKTRLIDNVVIGFELNECEHPGEHPSEHPREHPSEARV